MYFTFSKESFYGIDATSQDYVVDILEEEIIDNINYEKNTGFNKVSSQNRYPTVKSIDGRIEFEFTYGNEAWGLLLESIVGKRVTINGYQFAQSSERWKIVTGMLTSDLDSTSSDFSITEYKTGEFNNVDAIILKDELILVGGGSITDGVIIGSVRGEEGTLSDQHAAGVLAYGVKIMGGRSIDIVSRYRDGFSYKLPTSLTAIVYRNGDYFCFTGVKFSDLVFNAVPSEGITFSGMANAKNIRVIELSSPSLAVDNGEMVDTDDMGCYSMGAEIDIEKLYFQISNSIAPYGAKFFDSTPQDMIISAMSCYGQFSSTIPTTLEFYNAYLNNDTKNLSLVISQDKNVENAYVLAFNNIKFGTMVRTVKSINQIFDSVPFYCYGEKNFTIMIQK